MSRALMIIDHGSRREEAHRHLEWIAELVRARQPELPVYIAHMELAGPSIQEAIERCAADGIRELIIHPLFLVPGRHLSEDIPALVQAAASLHPRMHTRITEPIGSDPAIADLILGALTR